MTRVLLLHGGWTGHDPDGVADWAEHHLLAGCDVQRSTTLDALSPRTLAEVDVLVPVWTFDELDDGQEGALLGAVEAGLGLVAWHGQASAFLASRPHKHLLGGQFVGHPGGDAVTYRVTFEQHPLTEGLADVEVTSEQYYLLVDPAVEVLARTSVVAPTEPWLQRVSMPVAWTRTWGRGRVVYCSVGHGPGDLADPSITTLLRRAVPWVARGGGT